MKSVSHLNDNSGFGTTKFEIECIHRPPTDSVRFLKRGSEETTTWSWSDEARKKRKVASLNAFYSFCRSTKSLNETNKANSIIHLLRSPLTAAPRPRPLTTHVGSLNQSRAGSVLLHHHSTLGPKGSVTITSPYEKCFLPGMDLLWHWFWIMNQYGGKRRFNMITFTFESISTLMISSNGWGSFRISLEVFYLLEMWMLCCPSARFRLDSKCHRRKN